MVCHNLTIILLTHLMTLLRFSIAHNSLDTLGAEVVVSHNRTIMPLTHLMSLLGFSVAHDSLVALGAKNVVSGRRFLDEVQVDQFVADHVRSLESEVHQIVADL